MKTLLSTEHINKKNVLNTVEKTTEIKSGLI